MVTQTGVVVRLLVLFVFIKLFILIFLILLIIKPLFVLLIQSFLVILVLIFRSTTLKSQNIELDCHPHQDRRKTDKIITLGAARKYAPADSSSTRG